MRRLFLAVIFLAWPAHAQQGLGRCMPYEAMELWLKQMYQEVPIAYGMIDESRIMQLFVSPQATWTVLSTTAGDNKSCIIAAGSFWSGLPEPGRRL